MAIGTVNLRSVSSEAWYEIDNVNYTKYAYKLSSAPSFSTNFGGKKAVESDGFTFYEHYFNYSRYTIGSEVSVPKYSENKEWQYLRFLSKSASTKSSCYFAPKEKYGEYILRFDLRVMNEYVQKENAVFNEEGKIASRGTDYNAKIGLSFGKPVSHAGRERNGWNLFLQPLFHSKGKRRKRFLPRNVVCGDGYERRIYFQKLPLRYFREYG